MVGVVHHERDVVVVARPGADVARGCVDNEQLGTLLTMPRQLLERLSAGSGIMLDCGVADA
jgi:hypothetical protein